MITKNGGAVLGAENEGVGVIRRPLNDPKITAPVHCHRSRAREREDAVGYLRQRGGTDHADGIVVYVRKVNFLVARCDAANSAGARGEGNRLNVVALKSGADRQ